MAGEVSKNDAVEVVAYYLVDDLKEYDGCLGVVQNLARDYKGVGYATVILKGNHDRNVEKIFPVCCLKKIPISEGADA